MKERRMLYWIVLCLGLMMLPAVETVAKGIQERQTVLVPLFDAPCAKYGVPRPLALAIACQESGLRPWIVNVSGRDVRPRSKEEALAVARAALRAGCSFDVGVMQVNVYWIRKYRIPLDVALDPHANVQIGVWILAREIRRHGLNWKAVAYYHTPLHKNPARGRAYAGAVLAHLRRILAER